MMNYYRTKVNLHIYSGERDLLEGKELMLDAILLEGSYDLKQIIKKYRCPIFMLADAPFDGEERVNCLDKYMDVSTMMNEIMAQIGKEVVEIRDFGEVSYKTRICGIYGLCENEYQLPFVLTLGEILAEKEKVLVLDLQENSGFMESANYEICLSLEDLLLMARDGGISVEQMHSAIGKRGVIDFIYPLKNTEILSEIEKGTLFLLLENIKEQLDYSVILINFGSRFQGFFEMLNQCNQIYMMQKTGGLAQWREYEFMEELSRRGYQSIEKKLKRVEIPLFTDQIQSCEGLVDTWRWSEFGEYIRKLSFREVHAG